MLKMKPYIDHIVIGVDVMSHKLYSWDREAVEEAACLGNCRQVVEQPRTSAVLHILNIVPPADPKR